MNIKHNLLKKYHNYVIENVDPKSFYQIFPGASPKENKTTHLLCPLCGHNALQIDTLDHCYHCYACVGKMDVVSLYAEYHGKNIKNKDQWLEILESIARENVLLSFIAYASSYGDLTLEQCYHLQICLQIYMTINEYIYYDHEGNSKSKADIGRKLGYGDKLNVFYRIARYPISNPKDKNGYGFNRFIREWTILYLHNQELFDGLMREYSFTREMSNHRYEKLKKSMKNRLEKSKE